MDWDKPVDLQELLERTTKKKYSLRDTIMLKALGGNEVILMQLLRQSGGAGAPRREEMEELEGWLSREAWERKRREDI